jgi:hypothetical protein
VADSRPSIVNADDFGRLFESFTVSAFRLECLPAYDVTEDAEREAFRRWRAGEQPQGQDRAWLQTVRNANGRRAQMQRVRLVESPLSEYQQFELAHGYPANVAAGEDIRICDHRPDGLLVVDFWLFDDALAVVLEYDDQGRFLRPVVAETLVPYQQARDLALASAVPFDPERSPAARLW